MTFAIGEQLRLLNEYARFMMKNIQQNEIDNISYLPKFVDAHAETMASSATLFYTDFDLYDPLTLDMTTSADVARLLMLKAHNNICLVVDGDEKVLGLVGLDEVSDQTITACLDKNIRRDAITLGDVMVIKKSIQGLDIKDVEHADIKTVIEHLVSHGQQYCLVVDPVKNIIRGVFSAKEISKKLGVDINIQDHSSFYKVFAS